MAKQSRKPVTERRMGSIKAVFRCNDIANGLRNERDLRQTCQIGRPLARKATFRTR